MASKNKAKNTQPDHIRIKYVPKARMWCKTEIEGGKFKPREWARTKEELL